MTYLTSLGGGGGGSTVYEITATTTFTFTSESSTVVNTVLNGSLTSTNFKSATFIPQETTATSLDDFEINGLTFTIENIINNTSFDLRATAANNATGVYLVTYKITYI